MAECTHCGTETLLYIGGVPVCVVCDDLSPKELEIRAKLFHSWREAVKRADAASDAFIEATSAIPSGLLHPDGIQRIKNVSRQLDAARNEMTKAHNTLNDFLERGIVPEELK